MSRKLFIGFLLIFLCNLTNCASLNETKELKILKTHLNENKAQLKEWFRFYIKGLRTEYKPFKFNERIGYIDCDTCLLAVPVARLAILTGLTGPLIEIAVGICNSMDVIPPAGCDALIRSFIDPVLKVLKLRPLMQPKDFCGILEGSSCGAGVNPLYTDWDISIDENKPEPIEPPKLPDDVESVKIIQFTDLHVDLDYLEGTIGNCGSEVGCCREGEGEGDGRAGKYGHDECQLPEIGLEEIFTHAAEEHSDAKYIFLTGDFIHSVLWLYNKEENTRVHTHVFNRINHYFNDTPIYPVVGNHEPDVVNQFAPPEFWEEGFDLGWLYTLIDENFPNAVPDDQKETFLKYGYYHVSPEPGLRLLMINSNLCYTDNFWLAYYTNDSFDELQWLSNTLYDAEAAEEQVLIVGHVSPGSGSCWSKWSSVFNRIIYRYENIIKGQFYGHGHDDEFRIHFAPKSERPTSVQYIAPAGNPDRGGYAYKTYFVDGVRENATWEMIDHDEWVFDLESSNANNAPNWTRLYVASDLFKMKSQRPIDVYDFVLRMINDQELFNNYQWTYSKGGRKHYKECPVEDTNCKISYLCSAVTGDSSDNFNCEIIRKLIDPPLEETTPEFTEKSTEITRIVTTTEETTEVTGKSSETTRIVTTTEETEVTEKSSETTGIVTTPEDTTVTTEEITTDKNNSDLVKAIPFNVIMIFTIIFVSIFNL